MLANRPGYPFLGNDFFGAVGDSFACHPIDNLDAESELHVLRGVAPSVPEAALKRLVDAFQELRVAYDEGVLSYPFSLRVRFVLVYRIDVPSAH